MMDSKSRTLEKALTGGVLDYQVDDFELVDKMVEQNAELTTQINQSYHTPDQRRALFSRVFGYQLPDSTNISAPFNTDFGRHTFIKDNVFINKDCLFVDLGGIWIDEGVLIGPRVNLITVNHVEKPTQRKNLITKSIHIHKHAWLGMGVTVLPGVTIGENAIVGAASVVTKDVAANTVVVGSPARKIREVKREN